MYVWQIDSTVSLGSCRYLLTAAVNFCCSGLAVLPAAGALQLTVPQMTQPHCVIQATWKKCTHWQGVIPLVSSLEAVQRAFGPGWQHLACRSYCCCHVRLRACACYQQWPLQWHTPRRLWVVCAAQPCLCPLQQPVTSHSARAAMEQRLG
jgi:hypothetical protein